MTRRKAVPTTAASSSPRRRRDSDEYGVSSRKNLPFGAARRCAILVVAFVLACAGSAPSHAQSAAPQAGSRALETNFIDHVTDGTLFDNVVAVMSRRYYDAAFRKNEMPALVAQYRPRAAAAVTLDEQRRVTFDFLSHIPASHLGLLSVATHQSMMRDLESVSYPMLGFQLLDIDDASYATWVLEGGPAARAGLLPWDRVVSIDGTPPSVSPLVEWRSDDAFIEDLRDPPMHIVDPPSAKTVRLRVERRPNEFHDLVVDTATYSVVDADAASVRVIERGTHHVGYVHLWNVPLSGAPDLLTRALKTTFKDCDAVIIDLRGRGGSGSEVPKIVAVPEERSGEAASADHRARGSAIAQRQGYRRLRTEDAACCDLGRRAHGRRGGARVVRRCRTRHRVDVSGGAARQIQRPARAQARGARRHR